MAKRKIIEEVKSGMAQAEKRASDRRDIHDSPKNIDEALLRDIELTTANDEQFYRQHHVPWVKNFARKKKRGKFDKELALKGIRLYYVKDAVKRYNEINDGHHKLNKDEKETLAKTYLENVLDDVESGVE